MGSADIDDQKIHQRAFLRKNEGFEAGSRVEAEEQTSGVKRPYVQSFMGAAKAMPFPKSRSFQPRSSQQRAEPDFSVQKKV